MSKAQFGWTVVLRPGTQKPFVYKRDCPADAAHFAADLAPFTHPTEAAAVAAGRLGDYAYKKIPTGV